jgi:CHAT domain-containing protein
MNDMRCAVEAANNSGLASRRLGDFAQAVEPLQFAAQQAHQQNLPSIEGIAFSNLGLSYQAMGELLHAATALDRSKALLKNLDPLGYAKAENNLGVCYLASSDYVRAQAEFEAAISDYQKAGKAADSAITMENLGRTYMLSDRLADAKTMFDRALANVNPKDRSARAYILGNLGQLYWRRHELDEAEKRLKEADELQSSLMDRRGQSYDLYYLGEIARDRNDVSLARQLHTQALELRRASGQRENIADSLAALAKVEYTAGNLSASRERANESLALQESVRAQTPPSLRATMSSNKRGLIDLLVDITMQPAPAGDAAAAGLVVSERGRARALLDFMAEGSIVRHAAEGEFEARTKAQQRISSLTASLGSATGARQQALRAQLELALADDDAVERRIRESLSDLPVGRPLDSVRQLQQKLPSDSAILEYHLGNERSYLWLIQQGGIRSFVLPKRGQIEAQVSAAADLFGHYLDRLRQPRKREQYKAAMDQLSAALLGPLTGIALPERLILVLDGALHRAPFAALRRQPNGDALGCAYELVEMPAASFLMAGRKPRPAAQFPATLLAFADPVFSVNDDRVHAPPGQRLSVTGLELPRLPFLEDIHTAQRLTPAARLRIVPGFDANLANVTNAHFERYGVVEFSSHAIIDDQTPEISRVVLSQVTPSGRPIEGFLRPYQLSQLRLDGSVVVLSACDTALGKGVIGEGLIGLSSSLFSAGASQLVLTLTEVDGEGSATFMSEVYNRFLGRRPVRLEKAVRDARRSLAASERWNDPFYWASFILVGRPTE